ncbi:unnamed protein product, partial [Brassica napus]
GFSSRFHCGSNFVASACAKLVVVSGHCCFTCRCCPRVCLRLSCCLVLIFCILCSLCSLLFCQKQNGSKI